VRFTIRRLMAVVAFAAIALGAPHYPPRVFVALGCAGVVMAVLCVARAPKKAPTTEFLCALIGIVMGFAFMPAHQNGYANNDFRDLFSVIEGCAAGAVVGTVVAWADRRIMSRR
jgi:hypothetical protein